MASLLTKSDLRRHAKERLAALSLERRNQAEEALLKLLPLFPKGPVLSFYSFGVEVKTHRFNELLMERGQLVLPRRAGPLLMLHSITSNDQLVAAPSGLKEPHPSAPSCPPESLFAALIPALGFDESLHRLGYGGGHYDRLLASFPAPTYGLGFREQLLERLPTDPHDIALIHLFLL